MPILLQTHAERVPQRRFVDTPSSLADWQLLHKEADRIFPELRTVWEVLFEEARTSLDMAALREALTRGSLLDVERIVMDAWRTQVEQPAREALPQLIRETVARTADAVLPASAAVAPELLGVVFRVAAPEVLTAIDTYVGTQIVAIQRPTLLAVRATIRQGFSEGHGVAKIARDLRTVVGLTPRQQRAIEGLRTRLQEQGRTAAQVQQEVNRATALGIRRRAVLVARTESLSAANMGSQEIWRQSARQGLLDETRLQRQFLLTSDERLCPVCRSMRGQRRGLEQPFVSPYNGATALHPPMHPACRCTVRLVRISETAA